MDNDNNRGFTKEQLEYYKRTHKFGAELWHVFVTYEGSMEEAIQGISEFNHLINTNKKEVFQKAFEKGKK